MSGPEDVTISLLQGITYKIIQAAEQLQRNGSVTITAINLSISSAVNLVEILKHRIKGLHQQDSSEKVPDSNKTRVIFKLSLNPLDSSNKGYQKPIPENEVQEKSLDELRKPPRLTERREEGGMSERRGGRFERRGGRFERRGGRFERRGECFERRGGRFQRRGGRFYRRGEDSSIRERFVRGGRFYRRGGNSSRRGRFDRGGRFQGRFINRYYETRDFQEHRGEGRRGFAGEDRRSRRSRSRRGRRWGNRGLDKNKLESWDSIE